MSLEVNITEADDCFVGTKVTLPFIIYIENSTEPQDLTGFDLTYQQKRNASDSILLTKTLGDGITVADPTTGEGELVIEASDTVDFEPGDYVHALIRSNDPITNLWDGTFFWKKAAAP